MHGCRVRASELPGQVSWELNPWLGVAAAEGHSVAHVERAANVTRPAGITGGD